MLAPEALAQRVLVDQLAEAGDQGRVLPEGQLGLHLVLEGGRSALLQAGGHAPDAGLVGELGERGAPPEGLGPHEHVARVLGPTLAQERPSLGGQPLEAPEVDLVGLDHQPVAGAVGEQHLGGRAPGPVGLEGPPEPGEVALEGAAGRRRLVVPPDRLQQGIGPHRAPLGGEQDGEDQTRLVAPDLDRGPVVAVHLERTQNAELHVVSPLSP